MSAVFIYFKMSLLSGNYILLLSISFSYFFCFSSKKTGRNTEFLFIIMRDQNRPLTRTSNCSFGNPNVCIFDWKLHFTSYVGINGEISVSLFDFSSNQRNFPSALLSLHLAQCFGFFIIIIILERECWTCVFFVFLNISSCEDTLVSNALVRFLIRIRVPAQLVSYVLSKLRLL